jgi:hypothetical protein
MSQTAYNQYQNESILGTPVNEDFGNENRVGRIVKDECFVGRGITKVIGKEGQVRNFANNQVKLVFAGDLVTSNTVNLKVNGSAITQQTFSSDHATTMAALAVKIAAKTTYVSAASVTSAREITITAVDNTILSLTEIVVAAGGSQTTGSQTDGTRDSLLGVVLKSMSMEASMSDVLPSYPANSVANIMKQGQVWVYFETAFNPDSDTLYVRFKDGGTGKGVGQFRNDTDSGTCAAVTGNFKVLSHLTGAGNGKLELNKPV